MHSSYLDRLFQPGELPKTAKYIGSIIKKYRESKALPKYSHIAVRGVSGCVIGGLVAARQRKSLIVSRKEGVKSHASFSAEGVPDKEAFNYIIVDDFVCSGDTLRAIIKQISEANNAATCVGMVCYHENCVEFYNEETLALFFVK